MCDGAESWGRFRPRSHGIIHRDNNPLVIPSMGKSDGVCRDWRIGVPQCGGEQYGVQASASAVCDDGR